MKIIAVGDVHLGYKFSDKKSFERFLDELGAKSKIEAFVICGDFLDMWRRDMAGVVIESSKILAKLEELASMIKIYYVVGNHDYHLRNLRNFEYKFAFQKELSLQSGEVEYRFIHGYQFDPTQNLMLYEVLTHTTDELGDLAGEAWGSYIAMKSWYEKIVAFLKREKGKREKEIKNMLKVPKERLKKEDLGGIEKRAYSHAEKLKEKGEFLIFGHTHRAFLDKENAIANVGSWCTDDADYNAYLEIEEDKIELKRFSVLQEKKFK